MRARWVWFVSAIVSLTLVAGCGGGGSSMPSAASNRPANQAPLGSGVSVTPSTPLAMYVSVVNPNFGVVAKYDLPLSASSVPTIITGLGTYITLTVDCSGLIYTTPPDLSSPPDSINVFSVDGANRAHRIRVIKGANTKLTSIRAIASDCAGTLYAANDSEPGDPTKLGDEAVFAPGASGNATPIAYQPSVAGGPSEQSPLGIDALAATYDGQLSAAAYGGFLFDQLRRGGFDQLYGPLSGPTLHPAGRIGTIHTTFSQSSIVLRNGNLYAFSSSSFRGSDNTTSASKIQVTPLAGNGTPVRVIEAYSGFQATPTTIDKTRLTLGPIDADLSGNIYAGAQNNLLMFGSTASGNVAPALVLDLSTACSGAVAINAIVIVPR